MSSADVTAAPSARAGAWRAWLRLARISNTPTVASNTIAGAVLAAPSAGVGTVAAVAVAMSLFYTAGMVANDVLDLEVDRRERPERPLPAGEVTPRAAVLATVALFVAGEALLLAVDAGAALAGLGLIAAIVLYDVRHKGNPLSPVLMGLCRALVYVVAALAVAQAVRGEVWAAAALLWVFVVGLSQVAKAEGGGIAARWPVLAVLGPAVFWAKDLPSPAVALLLVVFVAVVGHALHLALGRGMTGQAVGRLIAAVALLDALVVAAAGGAAVAVAACVAAFVLTLALQTRIAGT